MSAVKPGRWGVCKDETSVTPYVTRLWEDGMNTADIAASLMMAERDVLTIVHRHIAFKRRWAQIKANANA